MATACQNTPQLSAVRQEWPAAQVFEQLVAEAAPGQRHERTLMLVLGDHGQTSTGDHGGGTPEEVDTVLLAVNLAAAAAARDAAVPEAEPEAWLEPRRDAVGGGALPVVEQLDFAASLSALLGLPLPFENVGAGAPPQCGLHFGQPPTPQSAPATDAVFACRPCAPVEPLHLSVECGCTRVRAARAAVRRQSMSYARAAMSNKGHICGTKLYAYGPSADSRHLAWRCQCIGHVADLIQPPLSKPPCDWRCHAGKVHPRLWALAPEAPGRPATTCACLPPCITALLHPSDTTPAACAVCATCLRTYATRISANAAQVHAYLSAYAATPLSAVSPASLSHLSSLMPPPVPAGTPRDPGPHTVAALAHLSAAAHVARTQWTQFDTPTAAAGLAVLALATILTAGALHATLFLRALHYTRLITSTRSFFALSCPPVSSSTLLPPSAVAMLALIVVRAAIPLSNSLVLAEAQVTQYLVATGLMLAAAAALSRAAVVRRSLSHAGHRLPPRNSPAVSAAVSLLSLLTALSRAFLLVPPPATHGKRSENVEPAANDMSPRRGRIATLSFRGLRVSFAFSRSAVLKVTRLTIALTCGATVVTSSSWLLRNLCFLTIVLQMFFTQQRRVIGAAWSLASILLSLAKMPDPGWLLPSTMLILCNTICCVHALWSPKATNSTIWSPLGIDRGTSAIVHIALYGAVACWSCMCLMRDGAINRIGASPFDKAAAADSDAAPRSGEPDDGWWDGVVAQAAPALVCLAMLSHHVQSAVQRAIAVPGTVRRFGTHVPWFKFFGDVVLLLHRVLVPLGLMSEAQVRCPVQPPCRAQ